jgi:hypothetical protein
VAVILALRRLRQEDCEFKASLGYISCLKNQKQKKHIVILRGFQTPEENYPNKRRYFESLLD